jgi:hypothetical protein
MIDRILIIDDELETGAVAVCNGVLQQNLRIYYVETFVAVRTNTANISVVVTQ